MMNRIKRVTEERDHLKHEVETLRKELRRENDGDNKKMEDIIGQKFKEVLVKMEEKEKALNEVQKKYDELKKSFTELRASYSRAKEDIEKLKNQT